ncbi:hypothetical protein EH165_00125 [Nakamurella antarctica]|uniref:Uncharacterized protein n=1 Tax=Nakamurella antarctica TaxID=1902245 RepID=A0A3G8ZQI0_9ACTN|nr:hypothetical protein [Nakamurella antarctica]AZI56814.1 hypothetical protein EH165_00125 [Nakamurella antarctica]
MDFSRSTFSPPSVASTAAPATWAILNLDIFADPWVPKTVGPDFEAYVRIFHPLDDGPAGPRAPGAKLWADVAEIHGRTMHPCANWDHINAVPMDEHGNHSSGDPSTGNLEAATRIGD